MKLLTPSEFAEMTADEKRDTLLQALERLLPDGGRPANRLHALTGIPKRTAYTWLADGNLIPFVALGYLDARVALKLPDEVIADLFHAEKTIHQALGKVRSARLTTSENA